MAGIYNYYQSNENPNLFIEIIPERKLKYGQKEDFHSVKKTVSLLTEYEILPENEIDYKTYEMSVIIKYIHKRNYKKLIPCTFSWKNEKDCYNALLLINNISKKANLYYKEFNRFPIIEIENIKVIDNEFDIVFTNFGLSLCDSYFVKNCFIDNSNSNDICKNIYLFMFELFFKDKNEWDLFEKEPKTDISIFVWYILKRLKSSSISTQRLDYLVNGIQQIGISSSIEICNFYFSEKLRMSLLENNPGKINWKGITKGILDLYGSFAITYPKINFKDTIYNNKLILNFFQFKKLHYLGSELINLNLNLLNLLPDLIEKYPTKVFKLLNFFSVFCIELQSLVKVLLSEKKELEYIKSDRLNIFLFDKKIDISFLEINNINKLIKTYNSTDNSLFDESVHYSLKEISFLCALKLTNQNIIGHQVTFLKNKEMSQNNFDIFLDTFLCKIPCIENSIVSLITEVNFSLSKNFQFANVDSIDIENIEIDILNAIDDLKIIRSKTSGKRYTKRKFTISRFGNKISINRFLKRKKQLSFDLSKGIPLTNLSPAHSSKFSYDIYKKEIVNTVIPNERFLSLIKNLKKGKLLGYRYSYLYYGKTMLFFDALLFLLFFSVEIYMTLAYDFKTADPLLTHNLFYKISHSSLWVIRQTFVAPLVFFVAKIFIYDLKFWFPKYSEFIELIKFKK